MAGRSEDAIAILVLAAMGLVLIAPLLGRNGAGWWADVTMVAASLAGVAAFALAARATLRASRRPRARAEEEEQQ